MAIPPVTTESERSNAAPQGRPSTVPIDTQLSKSTEPGRTPSSVGSEAYDDTVFPPRYEGRQRTIVLCFDGTGDQFDLDNSNIIQFFSMLKKDDKSQQLVYYQAGIGTYNIPEIATPFAAKVQKNLDMAFGNHLDAHVMGGYEFLMENYHAEDKICIFGFSRGAYTARALAGMIHKVGLLPAGNHQQVPFAYKMFSQDDDAGWRQSTKFKKAFSVDVEIEFVGVWDTVCSVGLTSRTLPFTGSNYAVRTFRHAISLDERRAKFKANSWHLRPSEDNKGTKLGEMPRSNQRHPFYRKTHPHVFHHDKSKTLNECDYDDGRLETDVLEVWFAGCHCDIGGGSVPDGTPNSLARIPLRWMIRQCFDTNTGIQFHAGSFKEVGLDIDTLCPVVLHRPKPTGTSHAAEPTDSTLVPASRSIFKLEEDEELKDALSPIYDTLKLTKTWWILEILPLQYSEQDRCDASWRTYWAMNMGRGREIPKPICERGERVKVHRSVKTRMEAEGLKGGKYKPKAKFEHLNFEWVD
ncbi:hypothetical protein BGW80DRAFT_194412 [Lactifluus volemus]|nr:hypothetical protein BGW80DRAFT_194412 [Lactifluus volemus]